MKAERSILDKLRGGDLRSIGRANEVAQKICNKPGLLGDLITGITSDDPVVRARSADALEKASSRYPELVQPYKKKFLTEFSGIAQQEVRWHVALIFSRLALTDKEIEQAVTLLFHWVETETSNIVRVSALQSLALLSAGRKTLKKRVLKTLKQYAESGSPSLRARSRKLLKAFQEREQPGK